MRLYKRSDSGRWWAHFSIKGKRYRLPTKTGNRAEAETMAAKLAGEAMTRDFPGLAEEIRLSRRVIHRPEQSVYLMRCATRYKIGIAVNVQDRAKLLQTGCPFPIEIVASREHSQPQRVEFALHQKYFDKRMQGEWF